MVRGLDVIRRSGMVPLTRPDLALVSLLRLRQLGPIAGAARVAAGRDGTALGLVDELGPLTYAQLDTRSNALARAFAARGLGPDSVIALLARDHRGAVDTMVAAGKLGARLLLMNTGFARPQLVDVARRERVSAIVHDQEFSDLVDAVDGDPPKFLAWVDGTPDRTTLDELIAGTDDRPLPNPPRPGGLVLLTSGTTGTPKGAPRQVKSPLAVAQFLDRIPLRVGEATVLAAPLFHGTGLSQFLISFALGSTVVVRRRFDPEETLRAVQDNRATALVLIPTMLRRILDLGPGVLGRYDTSSLRIVFCAGSALPPELGNRATEAFGDVVHNLYGSTEVAVATVATPADWRAAPGTVGHAPVGCRVALYDDAGHRITEPDVVGRVFVGSVLSFEGYTDGRHKDVLDGLLASGDVGHFDRQGRLFIDGRDDDMIVSGGENVFPGEVENLLLEHDAVAEAAVTGVPDDEFGQRLKAYLVLRPAASLDAEQVRDYVKANLARYKVPRDVVFVGELPRNATGKLLKDRLTELG
ncbi:acyl-CoA synthetase [Actinophytocola gossypii]|uniref:Acyl-CoA synthetase n=1 Tax=Actinophytocola gossypii TaxID=2812003 RepID=A0ABT2JJA0_9PSEU|nr:acyl-CoA synthetase [Actinophytocola gossypii]MCT2587801.1 acyl-CoA synthetase [Actinophytocola gossypii]